MSNWETKTGPVELSFGPGCGLPGLCAYSGQSAGAEAGDADVNAVFEAARHRRSVRRNFHASVIICFETCEKELVVDELWLKMRGLHQIRL